MVAKPALNPVEFEVTTPVDPPLYGDKPTFTYQPKDGGDPIVFPAHSTIRGKVDGVSYLNFLRRMDKRKLSPADQMFTYLDRSGCTDEMEWSLLDLPEDEVTIFFREWINDSDDDEPAAAELPPES
jgi:hypothetical protein